MVVGALRAPKNWGSTGSSFRRVSSKDLVCRRDQGSRASKHPVTNCRTFARSWRKWREDKRLLSYNEAGKCANTVGISPCSIESTPRKNSHHNYRES